MMSVRAHRSPSDPGAKAPPPALCLLLIALWSPAASAETGPAPGERFEELRLASVPLPSSADVAVVHPGQALEVFLAPSDFPDALVRLVQTDEAAAFSLNLDVTARRGEAVPRRVRWPRLGGRPLEVEAPSESLPLETPAGRSRPSVEDLSDPEARLEWYLRPREGDPDGPLRGSIEAVRLASPEGRTLLAWTAPAPPPPCAERPPDQPRCRFAGISRAVTALAIHPSGRWVAVAGGDLRPRVDLWRGQPLELDRRVAVPPWSGPPVRAEFTPDGQWLVVADAQGVVHAFEAETGGGHREVARRARSFVILDAGRLIATSDAEGGLTLWRTRDGTIAARIGRQAHGPSPLLAASGDGLRVAAASYDEAEGASVTVWDLEYEQVVGRIPQAGPGIVDLALDGDGLNVLATHDQRGLLRFEVRTVGSFEPFGGEAGRRCRGRLALSPDRSLLACVTGEPGVAVFDASGGRLLHTLSAGETEEHLSAIAFTPDGARLLGAAGGELLEWSLPPASERPR